MGVMLRFPGRRHARASTGSLGITKKSSAVTSPSLTVRIATAKSFESQTLPRLNREMVDRSHLTPISRMSDAIASSSSLLSSMNLDSCMPDNVHQAHIQVNPLCASSGMEAVAAVVHNVHMARTQLKTQKKTKAAPKIWERTYLREWRKKHRLSLAAAAAEMGIKYSQLSRIERGLQPYNQRVIEAAARVYSTSTWAVMNSPPEQPMDEAIASFLKAIRR